MKKQLLLKQNLFNACNKYIADRFKTLEEVMKALKESAENETKSTAGDKHDTAKAMSHLEQEKNGRQWKELMDLKRNLEQIKQVQIQDAVRLGSLVLTNQGNYYVSIAAGKIVIDEQVYFAISAHSPIGQALLNKKKNDEISFLQKKIKIMDVF